MRKNGFIEQNGGYHLISAFFRDAEGKRSACIDCELRGIDIISA